MSTSPHKRFYAKRENFKNIPKLQIKSGMMIEFLYRAKDNKQSRPLVLVLDTDEFTARDKKVFHGINLNYLPPTTVEKLFVDIITKTNFENDKETKFPKLNLYEEEDPGGLRPSVIFKPFIKSKILNRFDCWRSYNYTSVASSVKQIKWNFKSPKLFKVYENIE
tara:strand:+ start:101 stop:592 length:492 start_codon:yes stop_codon:yes gene_type:complete